MASEIRVNTFKNRSGLGTVSINDSGASFSGVVTATSFSGDLTGNVTSSSTSTFSNGLNVTGGDVGIGTDNPGAPLDVVTNSSAEGIRVRGRSSDSIGSLYFYNHTSATPYGLVQGRSTDFRLGSESNTPVIFNVNGSEVARFNTSGNLAFPSGQGIDFSATGGPTNGSDSSELLDDYEEGTWTPEIADAATGGNTITHSVQNGLYTKVGNIVTAYFRVTWSSLGSCASGSLIRIRNFPYSSKSNSGQFYYTGTITPIDGPTTVLITGNETHGIFYDDNNPNTAQTFANLPSSNLGNGLNGTITYLAN